jgi:anti-sigma factor RsiW
VTTEEARALYSDYLEDSLDDQTRDELQAFLAEMPESAAELIRFERTLSLIHRLPPREPALDLWREFAPKMAEYQAERKLPWSRRLRENWMAMLSQISAGVILYTQALAEHTQARLERYLLHDPLGRFHSQR